MKNQYIVQLKAGTDIDVLCQSLAITPKIKYTRMNGFYAILSKSQRRTLHKHPDVQTITRNRRIILEKIIQPVISDKGSIVSVAIIHSGGIDATHPDLNIVAAYDYTSDQVKQIVETSLGWKYLETSSHAWKKQLYVKGHKLTAATVWTTMGANKLSVEQAADNWDLPQEAIEEIIAYCEANKTLLEEEAAEELRLMNESHCTFKPQEETDK